MSVAPQRLGYRLALCVLASAACGTLSMPCCAQQSLSLANVHIIDVRAGIASAVSDIQIENGIIVAIRPRSATAKPRAGEVDGGGGYLLPGFWDMHAHVNFPDYAERWLLPMMLASGITGVRDMDGDCWNPGCTNSIAFLRGLQDRINGGALAGPRLLAISSALIHGPRVDRGDVPGWAKPGTAEQASRLVSALLLRGVDLVKTYDTLPREAYFGLMRAAKSAGLPVGGHVPLSVSTLEAVAAGQGTIDHAKQPLIDCSHYSATFHRLYGAWAEGASPRIYSSWAKAREDVDLGSYYQPLLEAYDKSLCETVIAGMAASKVGYVPTLITRRFEARAGDRGFLDDARLAHVPGPLRREWEADAARMQARFATILGEQAAYMQFYQLASRLTGKSFEAGVRILVGTDLPDSYCFPGDAFHEELRELSAAGLPNAAILRAATLDAAEFLGRSDQFGSVEVGKAADLVLLTGNPLHDISRTDGIAAVISGGRLWDRSQLGRLRAQAQTFAADYRPAATPHGTTP